MKLLRMCLTVTALAAVLLASSVVASGQQAVVTILSDTRPAYQEWVQLMAERFEAANPDIKIDFIPVQGDALQRMQVLLAAGVPLDIGWADPMYVAALARMGVLEDLAPYIERATPQYEDWYPSSLNLFRIGEAMYGLPIELQIAGIFYNEDMINEVGGSLPAEGWTYEDLHETSRRLLLRSESGDVIRHGFKIPTGRNWLTIIWAFGGDFFDDWVAPTRFDGNSNGVRAALGFMNELVATEAVQDRERHNAQHVSSVAFPGQHVGMILSNTLSIQALQSIENFTWDVAPLPHGPAGRVGFINSRGWVMFNTAQNKEATWRVLNYLTSQEALRAFVEIAGVVPPSREVLVNDWIPTVEVPANRHVLLEGVETARSPWPLDQAVFTIVQQEVDNAIWGVLPVNTALERMEERVVPTLEEIYGQE